MPAYLRTRCLTNIRHSSKQKGHRHTSTPGPRVPYTRNTGDAAATGLGRGTSRRGLTRTRSSRFQRRHTFDDKHILAMSFRAPISKQHSRLAPAWSTLLDPPQLPRAVAFTLCVVNVFLPGECLPPCSPWAPLSSSFG